jgi:phenylalanyl-tRNA synthetase beta chain
MKILLSWLQEFVPLPPDVRQIANDLTMLGLAVDTVTTEDDETVLELDITTNRPDCLSHYGVAREIAAFYGKPLAPFRELQNGSSLKPSQPEPKLRARRKDSVVEIVATDLCRRYSARIIRGVGVGPSPDWLARRLELVGVRSINNVADATNYILMAYGHPLHAFDLDRLERGKIVVRRAAPGEPLLTLDGVERRLTPEDLVIADARRPVALAGIMGGQESEISDGTVNVLLESAWFEPVAVRRTSKRQGLHTEASHRFERGADIGVTRGAADRCIEMIQELAGGSVDPREIDAFARPEAPKPVVLRRAELGRHLGLEPPGENAKEILSRLGFSPKAVGKKGWKCTVPTHRVDIAREIDLVEEVARHYGYDRFPSRLPGVAEGRPAGRAPHAGMEARVRALCRALGYDETISLTLVSRATEAFGDGGAVALENPLSEEADVLRTSLVPGLLSAVEWNLNRGSGTVRLFEIGNIYRREGDAFQEPARLAIAATGDRVEPGLGQPEKSFDFFDLKGDLEQLAELFESGSAEFDSRNLPHYYRGGHSARMAIEGETVARLGELSLPETGRWKFRRPVYLAEVSLDVLYARSLRFPRLQPISRFPAVERDFSILLPEGRRFEEVREAVRSLGIPEVVSVAPVEIFRGASVASGKYSLLVRITLQSRQATLTEAELAAYSSRIRESLEGKLGAQIRM